MIYQNAGKVWICKEDEGKEKMVRDNEVKGFKKMGWCKGRLAKSVPWDNRNRRNNEN